MLVAYRTVHVHFFNFSLGPTMTHGATNAHQFAKLSSHHTTSRNGYVHILLRLYVAWRPPTRLFERPPQYRLLLQIPASIATSHRTEPGQLTPVPDGPADGPVKAQQFWWVISFKESALRLACRYDRHQGTKT